MTQASLKTAQGIKVVAKGAGIGFTLDEPAQGVVAVSLRSGGTRWCARFGRTLKKDRQGTFVAVRAPASACPLP